MKTTQNKKDMFRQERLTLAEGRDKMFENFYTNIRVLVATQSINMVDLSRQLGLKSGARISDLCYGRGTPSAEEIIILAQHFKCTMDDLLHKTATITFTPQKKQ